MPDYTRTTPSDQAQCDSEGAKLLDDLTATINHYVVLPAGSAEVVASWIVHTHCHDAAQHSPILAVSSPTHGCGKSTLLDVIAALAHDPLGTCDTRAAGLFRSIEQRKRTVLVDEADNFLINNKDFLPFLNGGHRRGAATNVIRVEQTSGGLKPKEFPSWAPKAIFFIGSLMELAPTLADRSISIRPKKKLPSEHVSRFDGPNDDTQALSARIAEWSKGGFDTLRGSNTAIPSSLSNRAADNWRPLFAIADLAGKDWGERIRETASLLTAPATIAQGLMLLSDIRDYFVENNTHQVRSAELAIWLAQREDRAWLELFGVYEAEKMLPKIARLLSSFDIRPKTIRFDKGAKGTAKGYERASFEDAWARYLPECDGVTDEGGECDGREAA